MRLAAVFMEDPDHKDGGDIINFGGHFFYFVVVKSGICSITQVKSDTFIENLYDEEKIVTNVSAIVGTNGSGKTTLLYELIDVIKNNFISGFSIWEDEQQNWYLKDYTLNVTLRINSSKFRKWEKNLETECIYYSPYLDHKRRSSGIDLSADRYLAEDLSNIDSTFDANERVDIEERLKRSNYNRFIKFQKSGYSEGITEKYGLLSEQNYRVTFTRQKIKTSENKIDFHNTPEDFQDFLQKLYRDIRKEYENFDRNVYKDEDLFELNKKQMKNLILMDLFCLLIVLMEQKNFYLQEGHFKIKNRSEIISMTSDLGAYEKFQFWLNNYYYSKGVKHPLPNEEVLAIISFLYNYIDSLNFFEDSSLMDWSKKSLYFEEEKLNRLLDLNQRLLLALPKYYLATEDRKQEIFDSLHHIQRFANFEFAKRTLSSGETAMLNLFSRIYDFFEQNILHTPTVYKNQYYFLFLDEADLGYHPEWKRTYVSSIVDFCRSFFKRVGAKVQIILCTHDALSLSDIPNTNITYLIKRDDQREILKVNDPKRPEKTFAANITDLLAHSFFLETGLIGDFAKGKIQKTIDWLNHLLYLKEEHKFPEGAYDERNDHREIIELIDEPLLKYKLDQMFFEVFPDDINREQARQEIQDLARRAGLNIKFGKV